MLTRVRWRWRGWPVQGAGLAVTWRWGTLCGWQLRYTSWNSTWYSFFLNAEHLVTHLFTDNFSVYEQQSNNHAMLFFTIFTGKLTFTSGYLQNLPAFVMFFMWKEDFMKTLLGTRGHEDMRTVRLLQSFIECQTSVGGKVLVSQDRKTISNHTLATLHCCHSSGTT